MRTHAASAIARAGALLTLSVLPACSVPHVAPDPDDAGPRVDDAAPRADAPVAADAGASDAPTPDAGAMPDVPPAYDGGGEPDATGCVHDGGPPSAEFLALHADVIRPGCVGAGRFCHEGAYEGFGMLTPEIALANLVNVRGCGDVRVVPCRPDVSYASWVIRNGGEVCGPPFPPISGGSHPSYADASYFSEADVLAIEAWIRNGAR